jgi:hypothetical protein
MTTLYLACDWLVKFDQVPKLKDLNELVKSLDGEFRILPSFYFNIPVIDLLLVKLNETELFRFLEQVDAIGFTGWQDTRSDLFKDEFAFNPYRKSAFTQRTWEARLRIAHHHNHMKKEKPSKLLYPDQFPNSANAIFDLFDSERGPDVALAIRNFSDKSLDEIVKMLKEEGFLPNDEDK